MKVVQPTPSQAAVVLKQFLGRNGVEIKLGTAQEAIAVTKGYAGWNELASNEDPRGRKEVIAPASGTTPTQQLLGRNGDSLFSIVGRIHGDDDDEQKLIWAADEGEAEYSFKRQMLLEAGRIESFDEALTEEDGDNPYFTVYLDGTTRIGTNEGGTFLLSQECLPRPEPEDIPSDGEVKLCNACAAKLEQTGYCPDSTCPYHGWSQQVRLEDIYKLSRPQLEAKYGPKRPPLPADDERTVEFFEKRSLWVSQFGPPKGPGAEVREELNQRLKAELSDCISGLGTLNGWTEQDGRGELWLEDRVPFIQLSYDKQLSGRFRTELVVTLREHKLDVYVRTWDVKDNQHYEIVDEKSGFFDTNAERADEDESIEVLLRNALKEADAQKRLLMEQFNIH